jgi:predicted MPP superfamily phosphohydrolase
VTTDRRTFLAVAGAAAGAAAAGTLGRAGLVAPFDIAFPGHAIRLPDATTGRAAFAQLTDVHLRRIDRRHEAIAAELAAWRPDFVVLTGDTLDRAAALDTVAAFLDMLPPVPKLAVAGNWEYQAGIDFRRLRALLERHGGRLLVNERAIVSAGGLRTAVTGLDDLLHGRPDYRLVGRGTGEVALELVLVHCPAARDALVATHAAAAPAGIDPAPPPAVVLAGHTHGGQIRPFGLTYTPRGSGRYVAGWYDGAPRLFVSRGVGTVGLPLRLGARPEVPLFEVTAFPARS